MDDGNTNTNILEKSMHKTQTWSQDQDPNIEGGCETNSIAYKIMCQGCLATGKSAQYDGESARNGFSRGLEHQESLRNEREDSPLWKHCQLVHSGEKQTFSMSVVGSFHSCLERQINEAVRISSNTADHQSHKNPVSVSALLTGKFLQIRKVFAKSSLLAEEFRDTLQYKISR